MALKQGVCKNFGECDLADEHKIQEVESTDFVCEECGKPLTEIQSKKKKGNGTPNNMNKLIIAGIAGLIVVGGGAFALFGLSGDEEKGTKEETVQEIVATNITLSKSKASLQVGNSDTLIATITPQGAKATLKWASNDTKVLQIKDGVVVAVGEGTAKVGVQIQENKNLKAFCEYTVTKASQKAPEPEPVPAGTGKKVQTTSSSQQGGQVSNMTVANGKYTGPVKNGKPHGLGTLVFTRTAVINNSDSKQRTAQAGESVQGQFVNGNFTIGKHYDANGNLIESLNFGVAN